jgi:hypothetical protein
VIKAQKNPIISDDMHKSPLFYPGIVLRAGMLQQPIEFNREDHPIIVPQLGNTPLVLKAQIGGYNVERVFMDAQSGINLTYAKTLQAMRISLEFLKPTDCSFHGIVPGSANYPLGRITLDVCFGSRQNYRNETLDFEVIDWPSQYHTILG